MSFRTVIKKLAREKKLLEQIGLTSSVDENNNGEPITTQKAIKSLMEKISQSNDKIEDKKNKERIKKG